MEYPIIVIKLYNNWIILIIIQSYDSGNSFESQHYVWDAVILYVLDKTTEGGISYYRDQIVQQLDNCQANGDVSDIYIYVW